MLRVRPRSRPWVATALLVVATGPRWVAELGLADRVPDNRARVVRVVAKVAVPVRFTPTGGTQRTVVRTVRLVRTCR